MRRGLHAYGKSLVLILLCGAALAAAEPSRTVPRGGIRPPGTLAATTRLGPTVARGFRSEQTFSEVAEPVRLRIPALGVDGRIERLGLRNDGTIEVPRTVAVAGWYRLGARPGQPGPAVLLGHVDSKTGPGIFARLSEVAVGAQVRVERADGSTVTFRITEVSRVPKASFPTDLVYAPTLDPTLRLVTCGGSFDRSLGSYRDNVIVFATQV